MDVTELSLDAAAERATEVLQVLDGRPAAREALSSVQRMLDIEDQHWTNVFGGLKHDGLSLDDLHAMSESIREAIVKSPLVDRGAQLRHSYVWSKGIKLPETNTDPSKSGPKTALHRALTHPTNRRYFFDDSAHEELERALYSDGHLFALGENATKVVHRVPLGEITDILTNPDHAEEVWAWKREWQRTNRLGKTEAVAAWYYTDDCPLPKEKRAKKQIKSTPVDHGKTMIVQSVNRQVGWPLGIPDAVAAVAWAKLYSEFLKHGYVMSRSLAAIAFRATSTTKAGGENTAMKLATPQGAGSTAVMGAANTLTALPTAGRGYDFDSGRPIAAMVATSVAVSIVHLLSDPGAAGSSYSAAETLDLPTRRAIVSRQSSWVDFFKRMLTWMGAVDPKISFPSLDEPDLHRELQSVVSAWSTGLFHEDEIRTRLIALLSIDNTQDSAPDGVLLPNNEKSLPRRDIDTDSSGAGSDQGVGQGHSTGTGKGDNANDIRDDSLTNGAGK